MQLDTSLSKVIVYPDQARLTRQGQAKLDVGLHRLEISGLSIRANPESTRVSARGTAQARLLGLEIQRAFYAETPAEAVRDLEKQVETASDDLSAVDGQIAATGRERAQLDALMSHTEVYATALAAGEQTVDEQMALFERISRQAAALDAETISLGRQKREVERQLKQLQQQLNQARSQRPPERYTARVEIEVLQPGELTIELSYLVTGAGWVPLYDLRLTENGSTPELEIGYLAQVTQNSGEDWQDVSMTLSTARPALAAAIPELKPWFIAPLPPPMPRPVPAPAAKAASAERMALRAMDADVGAPQPAEMSFEAAEATAGIQNTGATVSYSIPGRVSIPPDGTAHKVVIGRYPLQPRLDYVTAPVLVQAVYRRLKVTNTSPYTLLPGKANLFAGDEFLGSTPLELTAPQGEIELYLGVDDRVQVERELVRREVDKTLIGGRRRIHFGYEVRLENWNKTVIELTLRDHFPVSRHEDIKVRLENIEPRATRQNDLNHLEWDLMLQPREKLRVRFEFLVEHPAAMDLVGLADTPFATTSF